MSKQFKFMQSELAPILFAITLISLIPLGLGGPRFIAWLYSQTNPIEFKVDGHPMTVVCPTGYDVTTSNGQEGQTTYVCREGWWRTMTLSSARDIPPAYTLNSTGELLHTEWYHQRTYYSASGVPDDLYKGLLPRCNNEVTYKQYEGYQFGLTVTYQFSCAGQPPPLVKCRGNGSVDRYTDQDGIEHFMVMCQHEADSHAIYIEVNHDEHGLWYKKE